HARRYASIVPPAVLFVLAAVIVVLAATAWYTMRAAKTPAEPVCAHCRYPTTDITKLVCPECGQDLRAVGILTPRVRARMVGSFFGLLTGWTLNLALIGVLGWGLLSNVGPLTLNTVSRGEFTPVRSQAMQHHAASVYSVVVNEHFSEGIPSRTAFATRGLGGPTTLTASNRTSGSIAIRANGSEASARILEDGVDFGAGVLPFRRVNSHAVSEWLAAGGVTSVSNAEMNALALIFIGAERASVLDAIANRAEFSQTSTMYFSDVHSKLGRVAGWAMVAAVFIVWLFGIRRLTLLMRVPPMHRGEAERQADQPATSP
ncbi:MAG: hypothetical protein ACTS27_04215, partial [Phycisphaerales bacterium]